MALTINTHPDDVITNAPEFDVSTSLTEGPSYQNLRVRATIYVGGESEAIAILEQPKGLDDWNLFDILKAMTGKADVPMGAGFRYKSATVSAELLTGWTQDQGNFTTFSVSGRRIISAVTSGGGGYDYAKSNDLGSVVAGDVIMVGLQVSYNDSGTNPFQLVYTDGSAPFGDNVNRNRYAGLNSGECRQQQMYFMLVMEDAATPFIFLGNDNDSTNLGAQENTIRKITDFKDNPCVYFKVKFQEVYENASDVTTIGDTEYTDTLMFVPIVVRPGEEFTDYLITDAGATLTDKIATRNIDGDIKYPFEHDLELRFFFVSTCPWVRIMALTDAGYSYVTGVCTGWGVIVISEATCTIVSTDADIRIAVQTSTYALDSSRTQSVYLDIMNDKKCYSDPKLISFIGDLGEETIIFRGLSSEIGAVEKSYYKDQNLIPKVLRAYKSSGMTLRALRETEEFRRLLHQLIYTELPVWMYNEDFEDDYREVTVLTDQTEILNQKELIEPEIEVVYYE